MENIDTPFSNRWMLFEKNFFKISIKKIEGQTNKSERIYVKSLALILILMGTLTVAAQNYGTPILNPFGLETGDFPLIDMNEPELVDIDDDHDMDCFIIVGNKKLAYFENKGSAGHPEFRFIGLNPFQIEDFQYQPLGIASVDLDRDGDFDLMIGDKYGFVYLENRGTSTAPAFPGIMVHPFGLDLDVTFSPAFGDLDGDGDFDMLAGGYPNSFYYENIGTVNHPEFSTPIGNAYGLQMNDEIYFPEFVDLDQDLDLDVLVGNHYGEFIFFRNVGDYVHPEFDNPLYAPYGLSPIDYTIPKATDLDGDGDLDLLVGGSLNMIWYYENGATVPLGLNETQLQDILLYPNPVKDVLTIQSTESFESLKLFSTVGECVLHTESEISEVDMSNLETGVYLLSITDKRGNATHFTIVKE